MPNKHTKNTRRKQLQGGSNKNDYNFLGEGIKSVIGENIEPILGEEIKSNFQIHQLFHQNQNMLHHLCHKQMHLYMILFLI